MPPRAAVSDSGNPFCTGYTQVTVGRFPSQPEGLGTLCLRKKNWNPAYRPDLALGCVLGISILESAGEGFPS